jgi:hypothetical protein
MSVNVLRLGANDSLEYALCISGPPRIQQDACPASGVFRDFTDLPWQAIEKAKISLSFWMLARSGRWSCNQRCKPLQVLSDGRSTNSSWVASRAAQSKPIEPQDALQVGEPHLNLLTLAPRLFEALGAGE